MSDVYDGMVMAAEVIEDSETLSPFAGRYAVTMGIRDEQYKRLLTIDLDNVDLSWVEENLHSFIGRRLHTLQVGQSFHVEIKRKAIKDGE